MRGELGTQSRSGRGSQGRVGQEAEKQLSGTRSDGVGNGAHTV